MKRPNISKVSSEAKNFANRGLRGLVPSKITNRVAEGVENAGSALSSGYDKAKNYLSDTLKGWR